MKKVRIKMVKKVLMPYGEYAKIGDEVEIDERSAQWLIDTSKAVLFKDVAEKPRRSSRGKESSEQGSSQASSV